VPGQCVHFACAPPSLFAATLHSHVVVIPSVLLQGFLCSSKTRAQQHFTDAAGSFKKCLKLVIHMLLLQTYAVTTCHPHTHPCTL
jgi:hypothetical protein